MIPQSLEPGLRMDLRPLEQLQIKRVVMRYGVSNYVARFFKTLKRRLNDFDRLFPSPDRPDYPSYWYGLLVFSSSHGSTSPIGRPNMANLTLPSARRTAPYRS